MISQIETSARSHSPISVAIVLLSVGRASRMGVGGPHKLLAEFAAWRSCADLPTALF